MSRALIIIILISSPLSIARADEPFECMADRQGVTYIVRLSGFGDRHFMTVSDSFGSTFSGRATVYRRGTRFYLPSAADAGFKLSVDGTAPSLCFADGGNDCHACLPIPSTREAYSQTCVIHTPRGQYTVTWLYTNAPMPELVLADETGEFASGAASYSLVNETIAWLPIGPNEGYVLFEDATQFCTLQGECYTYDECTSRAGSNWTLLPRTTIAECSSSDGIATLSAQAGAMFLSIFYEHREEGSRPVSESTEGPAIHLGADRWQHRQYRLSLFGATGELCAKNACSPCTVARPTR